MPSNAPRANGPAAEYDRRLARWRDQIAALERHHMLISNTRLIVAAAGAVTLWLAVVRAEIAGFWPVVCLVAFAVLVIVHARMLSRLERARRAELVYLRGLDRLSGRWAGTGRDGAQFLDERPYARDLDLFGRGSLFELLNTARTEAGEHALAAWLRAGAAVDVVMPRQAAVEELRDKIALREDIAVLASEVEVSRTGALAAWASANSVGLSRVTAAVFAACGVMVAIIAWLVYQEKLAGRWLMAWLIIEFAVVTIWRRALQQVLGAITTPERDLSLVAELLARLESEPFAAPRLMALKSSFFTRGVPPSRRIAQLRRYVSWLDSTRNQMFAPFAYPLLLPQLIAVSVDRWHAEYGGAVIEWLQTIGEMEALSALGTYAYEHPGDPFPTLATDGITVFDADSIGHPLMSADIAVRNDVRLGGHNPHAIVISGSNMSGKSTLLRSIGVNAVLALAGAPVRATRLHLSPIAIGATLRIEDSLQTECAQESSSTAMRSLSCAR